MTPTDPSTPHVADPDQLPKHTTPTWEVELLISGVAVFAMLQLPGWLDDRYFTWSPRFGADWTMMLLLVYLYLKCAAVILAVTFASHLSLRAYWIALIGMHSVYPDGMRWEKHRVGPVQMEIERRRFGDASATIERADNRATIVFALGVAMATNLIVPTMLVLCGYVVAFAFTFLSGEHLPPTLPVVSMALLLAPVLLSKIFDRIYGSRLRTDGAPRRWLLTILRFYDRFGFGQRPGVMELLSTHAGNRIQQTLIFLLSGAMAIAVVFQFNALQSPQQLGSYQLFPKAAGSARSIGSAHYDDQRDPVHDAAVPYIQSLVIAGPYLQLMVPYQPALDTPALQQSCPSARIMSGDAASLATLDCLARIYAVTLDGAPISTLSYDVASDPRTQRPSLQAMIDVRSLAPGRHELRVTRAPPDALRRDRSDITVDDVIPFWH